jgi:hypothetical protein
MYLYVPYLLYKIIDTLLLVGLATMLMDQHLLMNQPPCSA